MIVPTDHRQLLQPRILQYQLLQAILQADERVIFDLPENANSESLFPIWWLK